MLSERLRSLYTLRSALFAFVLLPLMLFTGITGWYSLRSLEQQIGVRMQEDIELIARAIRRPLNQALQHGSRATIESVLDTAFGFDRVYGVYIYDANGRRIAASGTHKAVMTQGRAARLAGEGERQGGFEEAGNERVYSYFVPLTDAGERISGLLQVTRRGSDFDRYLAEVRTDTLAALALVGALLALLLLAGHHRAVGRHLQAMERSMTHIRAGEHHHRLNPRGPKELRVLAHTINTMLDGIVRSDEEIARRRSEEFSLKARLHQSEKMAALGRLAAGVAHELGTPLSVVDGKAQQALRRPSLPAPAAAVLQTIRAEVARMEHIIRQLMDFGRNNSLVRRAVPADQLARATLGTLEAEAQARGVQVTLAGPERAPVLNIDRIRAEQALVNLLRNALQASRKRVRLSWFAAADGAGFTVEDDGPGVDEATRARLFEPFFTTKRVGDGTGLGLAVVHAVVSEHAGEIDVGRSAELGGARFRIVLARRDGGDERG